MDRGRGGVMDRGRGGVMDRGRGGVGDKGGGGVMSREWRCNYWWVKGVVRA